MSRVLQQLGVWQQELLDLSNRNRLLNFRPSTTRPSSIQLMAPQFEQLYEDLIRGNSFLIVGAPDLPQVPDDQVESALPLFPAIDADSSALNEKVSDETQLDAPELGPGVSVSNLTHERTSKVALRLLRQARTSEQEQGINILFAVFGLLRWSESDVDRNSAPITQFRQAPLLLLPLAIEETASDGGFRIAALGEDIEFNQTLSERLKRDFGLLLPESLDDEESMSSFFSRVQDAVDRRQGWQVLEQVHIGLFQFHKIRMFKDLSEHSDLAAAHDIIRALAQEGVTIARESEGLPPQEDFDATFTPQESYSVLDADASQLGAIQAVTRGSHLLIEGPPGTGKSQTIANIIAESIAAGKTVLFVSEKAAAIEVVHRRLALAGLGDFCLMLHSHKANKRDIIYDLATQLEPASDVSLTSNEELQLRQLQDTRMQINAYVQALHRRHAPMGVSAFWAHGELARLQHLPLLVASAPPHEELTLDRLEHWQTLIAQSAGFSSILHEGSTHPWSHLKGTRIGLAEEGILRQLLHSLRDALVEVQTLCDELTVGMALPRASTLSAAKRLIRIIENLPGDIDLLPMWLDPMHLERIEEFVKDASSRVDDLTNRANTLFLSYTMQIMELATPETIAAYEQGFMARTLLGGYRQARRSLRLATREQIQHTRDEQLASLRQAAQLKKDNSWFHDHSEQIAADLGVLVDPLVFPDAGTYEKRARGVAAAASILGAFHPDLPSAAFITKACSTEARSTANKMLVNLQMAMQRITDSLIRLTDFLDPTHLDVNGTDMGDVEFASVDAIIQARIDRWTDLHGWFDSRLAIQRIEAEGLRSAVDQLLADNIPADQWSDVFRRFVVTHWLDQLYMTQPELRKFRGQDHVDLIGRFKHLDRQSIDFGPRRLRQRLLSKREALAFAQAGEPAVLRHEGAKRRRHMPLRRLFARIPNLLPTLKPCLMMSPLSVAQFLPADRYKFDLVIFDEASQVRPYDAIGAIMRGKQLVVAGDSKQLPPTNFFDRADDLEIEEDEDLRALESILDGLRAKDMPSQRLLWHYRSRHEDLIAYSNHHFYDDRLITFPSPASEPSPGKGVRLEFVPDGRYELESDRTFNTAQRVNRIEARRVAQLVMDYARHRPSESFGVVTLGSKQRDAVDDEIRRARLLDLSCESFFSEDAPEPFFVKALEQVQGDERDVMMISIGFGKNAEGILSHNFGPINRDGGERRLNVLVTRARHEVIVVSSIKGNDIDLSRTQRVGPRLLKNYLDFAEQGRVALAIPDPNMNGEYESPFEESVGIELQKLGYTIHKQIGASKYRIDLAVVHPEQPGRYLLGIECDGRTYHQSKTARDRDRLRQEVLEGLGWTIHRIWSTEWIRHRENEIERLVNRIDELIEDKTLQITENFSFLDSGYPDESDSGSTIEGYDNGKTIASADSPRPAGPSGFSAAAYNRADIVVVDFGSILEAPMSALVHAISECARVEGPVHKDVLVRRIVSAWGHRRTGARIASRLNEAILLAAKQQQILVKEEFLWSVDRHIAQPRGADDHGVLRDIKYIADEEILEAVKFVLQQTFSLTEDELIVYTARFFGYQRTGADIGRRLYQVLKTGIKQELIQLRGDRITLTGD